MSINATKETRYIWSSSQKICFRFFFLLFGLLILLKNNGAFPFFTNVLSPIGTALKSFIPWFSKEILHYTYDFSITTNGSGDTSYDWILLLLIFITSAIGTIIWSLLDRRPHYQHLYYWLTVLLRFYLALTFINYGFAKLFSLQFIPPIYQKLVQPLAEFSPMGLAWTFFGHSTAYNVFMGTVEVLSILLLFRRTAIIGALLSLATSVQIMTLNYFFDIPVKLLSSTLMVMSFALLIPYLKSLYTYFILQRASTLAVARPKLYSQSPQRQILLGLKMVFLAVTFIMLGYGTYTNKKQVKDLFIADSTRGIYKVTNIKINQQLVEPTITSWQYFILDLKSVLFVRTYDNKELRANLDTSQKTMQFSLEQHDYKLTHQQEENGNILLTGLRNSNSITIQLEKVDLQQLEINRDFRWINEYPHNR